MAKKILITGVTGFAGSFLAQELLTKSNATIFGTYLSEKNLHNIAEIKPHLRLQEIDLQKRDDVFSLIESIEPDMIYHLAALPAVGASFARPLETIINNVAAQLNVLEAIKDTKLLTTRILIVSSADVYGKVAMEDIPTNEETPLNPINTYAVSKIAQDYLALQYANSFSLQIIRARPFNHIGPRQTEGFVVADFAKKIAEIEKGRAKPELYVGNLEPKRDFTDVRDIVCAYVLLMEKGKVGEVYNIGSGISHKIGDILDKLLSLSTMKITVTINQDLVRSEDAPDRRCDNTKIHQLTGWKSRIPIEQTLQETLDYWRKIS